MTDGTPEEDGGRVDPPETRYAWLPGGDRVAYQVLGEGPVDLLYVPSMADAIDTRWEWPPYASFMRRLASFARLIQFDCRGFGSSDPVTLDALGFWETWGEDARAVLEVVGSDRAAVLGAADAAATAMLFAAAQPELTHSLILVNAVRHVKSKESEVLDDYPPGVGEEEGRVATAYVERAWGTEELVEMSMPEAARDPAFRRFSAKSNRLGCSPREAGAFARATARMDVRDVLPAIRVPTLVLHRERSPSPWFSPEQSRYLADRIPGARFVTVPGIDMVLYGNHSEEILAEIEQFLTGVRHAAPQQRVLATVLMTDIVGSTDRLSAVGDRRWTQQLEEHDRRTRSLVEEHGGRVVTTTGDGVLAAFDGPGRAILAATELIGTLASIGIQIRAGLHTGEVELRGDDIAGIAVHLVARIMAQAVPGQLLVSAAVPLLVAGSGIAFAEQGDHELKGLEGMWRLYSAEL